MFVELARLESNIWDLISTDSCVILAMGLEEEASSYESQVGPWNHRFCRKCSSYSMGYAFPRDIRWHSAEL